ncbi:MAG: ATP-binding protein [Clostridiales bacterium]|jgi:AAA+ ATPase superfamily predicted ATPase|nr:ATP-binding protein [Clostridiales bacterium]
MFFFFFVFHTLGRKRELDALNKAYDKDGFNFSVVYGRRRVGKTSLINEFLQEGRKKVIFYTATEQNNLSNLQDFSEAVFSVYPEGRAIVDVFPSWDKAFEYIAKQAKDEKLVLVIDEYPYLAGANKSISSILQRQIDTVFCKQNIKLILCGSSMSFMENQILGYQSPLYGRRGDQYKIEPLDYYDSAEFFDDTEEFVNVTYEEKLLGYAVTGGIPQYLNIIKAQGSVETGIKENFFGKFGYLYEEPQNLLKQELREPAVYNTIIAAIANGATKLNEIATKSGEENAKCNKYLKGLVDLGIVEKENPIDTNKERNGVYRIKDHMYRFWYRFVPENVTNIESGKMEFIYRERVEPYLNEYMGHAFEDICKQYMLRRNIAETLPFVFDKIGRWWGSNPKLKQEEEIDLVAVSRNKALFCECKWRNEKADLRILKELKRKAELLCDYTEKCYCVFSKSGFTDALKQEACDSVLLIDLADLFDV